jgi:hypothetical protein
MFRLGEIAAGELVGLAMRQVAVKWNTTDERPDALRPRRALHSAVWRLWRFVKPFVAFGFAVQTAKAFAQ